MADSDGTEITLDELIDKYYNNPDECFVKGYPEMKEVDDSNDNNILTMAIATRNNVNYQHQIIQKNIFQNNPTLWKNVLTEFPEKVVEESYSAAMADPSGSNTEDESYWTKGKWRDYLQLDKEQQQNLAERLER